MWEELCNAKAVCVCEIITAIVNEETQVHVLLLLSPGFLSACPDM